jgi:L-rhamnose mutarotase
MERGCLLLKVKPGRLAEYKERHKAVWPEMLDALRETGWHNYSLFLREDGLLVGYFETPDYQSALAGIANREVNLRWQREMAPFFENLEDLRPDFSQRHAANFINRDQIVAGPPRQDSTELELMLGFHQFIDQGRRRREPHSPLLPAGRDTQPGQKMGFPRPAFTDEQNGFGALEIPALLRSLCENWVP